MARLDADPDGDDIPNSREFAEGSNPAQLRFHRLAEWREKISEGFRLRWFASAGNTYVVESAPSADGPWTVLQSGVVGDGSLKEFLDANSAGNTKFYRVRIQSSGE